MDYEFSFEEADALLMRNWFYEDEDIDDLIWLLTEEVFHQVYEKRFEYPYRVSLALRMHEPIKTKAGDFTDEMMDEMIKTAEIERITLNKKEKDAFICPPRPEEDCDKKHDQMKYQIEKIEKDLDKYVSNYYADKVSDLRKELLLVKNENDKIEKIIINKNRDWLELQWIIARSVAVNHTL